jgi:serine/threonine protein kinase
MSLIGKKVGNYEIKSKLGEGGMGAVYLGEHPLIGKKVAIKVLLEEFAANEVVVTRFFNEAKAVNDIGHQNIVDIVDFGKMPNEDGTGEMVYFVMELLNGESLADRIKREPLSTDEVKHVIEQCCDALAASHAKGIVHRDLKPDNIYLCVRGRDKTFVKILDFGIAKLTGAGGASSKTRTGTVIGTPYYMSPEQCAGRGHIDHRSDIYSLGCVMYELVTGQLPFPGEGFGDILVAHLTRDPPKPSEVKPGVDPALEQAIITAMTKDKEKRFPSMIEMGSTVSGKAPGASGDFKFRPLFEDEPSRKVNLPEAGQTAVASKPGFNALEKKDGKPITTLSGAASESLVREPRGKGSLMAAIAGIVVLGGVGGYLAFRPASTPAPMPVKPAAVIEAPKEEPVDVRVTSTPPGAMVMRADQAEGPRLTPAVFHLKKGEPSFDISIKLDGYKPQTRTIKADMSKVIDVSLAKEETTAAAPVPAVPVEKKKKKKVESQDDDMRTLAPVFN